MDCIDNEAEDLSFDAVVENHYESLYRFALSLTPRESDACDLTQQTFYQWATKNHQLRDKSKVKSWLFTTLYREHLKVKGYELRFLSLDRDSAGETELAALSPSLVDRIDSQTLLQVLFAIEEFYRAPLVLFYLEDHSYKDIAEILGVPVGTVMSRLSRAKNILRRALHEGLDSRMTDVASSTVVSDAA
jgi:RNA polymerase sigma factor (sigma-70 family)